MEVTQQMQAALVFFTIVMVIVVGVILTSFKMLYNQVKKKSDPVFFYVNIYKDKYTNRIAAGIRYETEGEAKDNIIPLKDYLGTVKI